MGERLSVNEKVNIFCLVGFVFVFCTCSKYKVGELYILSNTFNFSEGC